VTEACVRLYCDGGARGNPGPAGAGAVLVAPQGKILGTRSRFLGAATNNVAEYRGVLLGLELARSHGVRRICLCLDSELVVRQLTGQYRVRHPELRRLWTAVHQELKHFSGWEAVHVPRRENRQADRLVNEAVERHATVSGG